jgi:hypothetical protein
VFLLQVNASSNRRRRGRSGAGLCDSPAPLAKRAW